MSQMITWEYYVSHFPQIIPDEETFASVERQAQIEYRNVIYPYMEVEEEREKDCIFALCNYLYANADVLSGRQVTSVNNNGYSESYSVQSTQQAREGIRQLIKVCTGIRLAGAF